MLVTEKKEEINWAVNFIQVAKLQKKNLEFLIVVVNV